MPQRSEIETLFRRLAQTMAWCTERVSLESPKTCLRSSALRPGELRTEPEQFSVYKTNDDSRTWKKAVDWVAMQRANLLCTNPPPVTHLRNGRLMLYEPNANLAHGFEEEETRGYLDINNVPPWDTWVMWSRSQRTWLQRICESPVRDFLIAWVPTEVTELVNAAIEVNAEECIAWLDQQTSDISRELGRIGLLDGGGSRSQ